MASKVFISYEFDKYSFCGEVRKWLQNGDIEVVILEKKGLPSQSDLEGQSNIARLIAGCDGMLVLVGQNTHNRPWVNFEVKMALRKNISVIWTRLPNTTGGPPPRVNNNSKLPYDQKTIIEAVRRI